VVPKVLVKVIDRHFNAHLKNVEKN